MSKEQILREILNADSQKLKRVAAALRGDEETTKNNSDDNRLITFTDAAKLLAVSRQTIYQLAKSERLDIVELNGNRRITMKSIRAFANGERPATNGGEV